MAPHNGIQQRGQNTLRPSTCGHGWRHMAPCRPPAPRSPHHAIKTQKGEVLPGLATLCSPSRSHVLHVNRRTWPCCGIHVIQAERGRDAGVRACPRGPPHLPPETAPAHGRPVGWAASRRARPPGSDTDAAPCARGPTAAGAAPVTPRGATCGAEDGSWLRARRHA